MDWKKMNNAQGVPFYINSEGTTTFVHPAFDDMKPLFESLDDIQYAAYRTASKMRALQQFTHVNELELKTIQSHLNKHHMDNSKDHSSRVSMTLAGQLLEDIFYLQNENNLDKDQFHTPIDCEYSAELTLSVLINMFDCHECGSIDLLAMKIVLTILCKAELNDKYQYIFNQVANKSGFMDEERLRNYLQVLFVMVGYVGEERSFGEEYIEPTIEDCRREVSHGQYWQKASYHDRVLLLEFIEWMMDEPQSLVWIPTLHRLAASENVKHNAKCNICKMFPIIGFRYRCLKCFNFDQCQACFWSKRLGKKHKLYHPTREYTLPTSRNEDVIDFRKVVKSKVLRQHTYTPLHKTRYIPIVPDPCRIEEPPILKTLPLEKPALSNIAVNEQEIDSVIKESKQLFLQAKRLEEDQRQRMLMDQNTMSYDQRQQLNSVIHSLEADNRKLHSQIDRMRAEQNSRRSNQSSTRSEYKQLTNRNEVLTSRQEVLEEHNRQLELQLQKLRMLLQQIHDESTKSKAYSR